jgi:hypothetical protein
VTIPAALAAPGSFNWTTVLVAVLNLLVGGALVSFIRSRPSLKKVEADREANLLRERAKEMQEMRERIERLEAAAEKKDEQHSEEIKSIEAKQTAKDRYYEAMSRAYVHSKNNLDQAFNALLMLLKRGVSVEEAVAEVEAMRSRDKATEAKEIATIRAAAISAGLPPPDEAL